MITFSLQSGSSGNCIYYESDGVKLLIDAGISLKSVSERLIKNGINKDNIDGLLITHDHTDHSKSISVLQSNLKMPLFISPKTMLSVKKRDWRVSDSNVFHFNPGEIIEIKHLKITTIRTPHDGVEPSVFIIDDGKTKVGIFTDLGHCFTQLINVLWDLDVIYMESNYDARMLRDNIHYPGYLKRRIAGYGGHISNKESAMMINTYCEDRLKYLFLSHLSENNNSPEVAMKTHKKYYQAYNCKVNDCFPNFPDNESVAVLSSYNSAVEDNQYSFLALPNKSPQKAITLDKDSFMEVTKEDKHKFIVYFAPRDTYSRVVLL